MIDIGTLERKFAESEKTKGEEKLSRMKEIREDLLTFAKAAASDWDNYKRDCVLRAGDLNTKVTNRILLLEAAARRKR